jgi:hypothetical protein
MVYKKGGKASIKSLHFQEIQLPDMFPTTLLTTLVFTLSVAGSPTPVDRSPVTLPLSRHLNLTSIHNLVLHDQARAKGLIAGVIAKILGGSPPHNEQIYNQAVSYTASVGVGSPPTTCKHYFYFLNFLSLYLLDLEIDSLIIDTGRYEFLSLSFPHPNS